MSSKLSFKELAPEQRKEFMEKIMRENAYRLIENPKEIYHINISVYKPKINKPERLTVNVDFIFDRGQQHPFKTVANCVNKSRMREITSNCNDWGGYEYMKASLKQDALFAGKLRNRKIKKSTLIPSRIIRNTGLILKPAAKDCDGNYCNDGELELIISDETYNIQLYKENGDNSSKYFELRGYYQKIEEEEW